ncbi:hypothetical protein PGPR2_26060 [Pseudomonas aeruginosa PGPR2]|nr:hypothetical protein PGPR2_26060 [Pseudomonas aeruginosa PGPR2]
MILGLCLTAMAGLLGYQQYQLIQLRSSVDSAAEKTSLEAILARLNRVDERLDAVDGHHLVSNEDFRSGQQALSNRIDAAQAFAKQASDAVENLAQTTASAGDLLVLKATVETLDGSVRTLQEKQTKAPPLIVPAPKRRKPPRTRQAQAETQTDGASALLDPWRGVSRGRTVSVGCTSGIHPAQPDLPHSPRRCRRRHDLATDRP